MIARSKEEKLFGDLLRSKQGVNPRRMGKLPGTFPVKAAHDCKIQRRRKHLLPALPSNQSGGRLGQNARPWNLQAPAKIVDPGRNTNEVIKHAYYYSHYPLKYRRATPKSKAFLEQYRDVAGAAINQKSRESKVKLVACNEILHSKVLFLKEPSILEREGQEAFKALITQRYIRDYGDCVAESCKKLRDGAEDKQSQGREFLTGGEVQSVIAKEQPR